MTLAKESEVAGVSRTAKFLSAEWLHLIMVNYQVDPELLVPWLPRGLELDDWEGKTLVSLVAFEFLGTRVLGLSIPGHRDFPEVNLRFYVRRRVEGDVRRGVVFIRELVPRRAIAWTARLLYGERYRAVKMNGTVSHDMLEGDHPYPTTSIRYWWWMGRSYQAVCADCEYPPRPLAEGSQAAFMTDRAWGYSVRRGKTLEYEVEHPPWCVWDLSYVTVDCEVGLLCDGPLGEHLKEPCSGFVAEGSPVVVRHGRRIA